MKGILSAVPARKENPQSGKDLERALTIECSSLTVVMWTLPPVPIDIKSWADSNLGADPTSLSPDSCAEVKSATGQSAEYVAHELNERLQARASGA
jgi:hypothetical protein